MSANLKRAVKRIKAKLNADYETAQATPTAGPVGTGKAFIAGQVFDGAISGVTQVVNVGRPAAAQYAPKVGGGVTVVSGGGGGASSPVALSSTPGTLSAVTVNQAAGNHTHAIDASAAPGAAESLLKSTSAGNLTLPTLTASTKVTTPAIDTASGNLTITPAGGTVAVVGAQTITGNSDGSGSGNQTYQLGVGKSGAGFVQLGTHGGYPAISGQGTGSFFRLLLNPENGGSVGIGTTSPSYRLDVNGTMRAATSLTTPLITTATNTDLLINPAGTGSVMFQNDQKIRTSTFDGWTVPYTTGFQINEFEPVPGGSASVLTIGRIQADELDVRVFVANETRVSRGDEFWTKSFGVLAESFTTPTSIGGTVSVKFENSPALVGAIFVNNDWVLIRKLEIDTGLSLYNVWGQVATYVNNGDGTQSWTFTLRGGPTEKLIERGSLGIDFGQVGAGLIHLSVVDTSGSPYIKLRKWVSGSDPMTIDGPNFNTYVQIGNLDSVSNSYYSPDGYGLYIRSTAAEDQFMVADDNGLQIRGPSIGLYNSTTQTILMNNTSGINVREDVWGSWDNRRALQWWPDVGSMSGDPSLSMYTGKVVGGLTANQNFSYIDANPTGNVLAGLSITAFGQGTASDATLYLEGGSQSLTTTPSITMTATSIDLIAAVDVTGSLSVGGTAVSLNGHTHSYLPLSGGTLTGTVVTDVLRPAANNTKTVGDASYYYSAGYFNSLYVNTIVGTPSYSHTHAASDITSGTLNEDRIPHNWTGALTLDADSGGTYNYLRIKTDATTPKIWDIIGYAQDHATTSVRNDLAMTFYDGTNIYMVFEVENSTRVMNFGQTPTVGGTAVSLSGHTHDDRYFTETESNARFAALSHNQAYTTITYSGLTSGHFFKATGATSAGFSALSSSDVTTALGYTPVNKAGDSNVGALTIVSSTEGSGSSNQTYQLGISKSGAGSLQLGTHSGYPAISGQGTGSSFRLLLNPENGGNVGINRTDPSFTLDVNGTGRFVGALSANAGATVTGSVSASTSVITPTVTTSSGNLTLTSAGGTVAVTGALTASSTATITTSVSTPIVTTGSGNLSLTSTGGTVAVTGALTGSSTGVFTSTLTAASDTDAINTFGRVLLGYAAATDTASFSHFDNNTSTNFALSQSAAGATTVNAASGQTVRLSNAGVTVATVGASGIDLQPGEYVGSSDFASRQTGWRVDQYGGGDFRYVYTDQLHAKSFIADLQQALAGSQVISKSVAVLAEDFIAPYAGGSQLLVVEDLPSASNMAVFEANDIVTLKTFSRSSGSLSIGYCFGVVTGYTDGTGTQTWTFTRSGTTTYNAITQRGTATSSSTASGTSVTVTKPTGVVSGDVMLAVVTHDGTADAITATGWTIIGTYTSGTDINFAMYYRVAGGAEGANYSFSTVSTHALAASIVAYYNVDSLILDDYSISNNSASTNMTGTTVFGTATANMLVFLGGITNNSAVTPAAGMTELVDAGSTGIRVYVAHQTLTASGETGSKVATIAAIHASIVGMVALRPTYSAMTQPAGTIAPGTVIEADGLVLDYGVSGNGIYEVSAIDGPYASYAPYARVATFTTHPLTDGVVRTQMGNLSGLSGASANEYGLYAGSGTIATTAQYLRISTAGVQLNNIPIKLYNAGTQTVNIDSAGTDIWVGTSSSDKRLQWNGTSLNLNNSAGTAVITFDNSGGSYFAGPMTIGTSGGIYQGSGTFASPTTGLKIWNDTSIGRIGGYNGGTLQWYANTDGKLYAGGGNVVLDSTGISTIGGSSFIIKQDSATTKGYIYSSNPLDSLLVNSTGVGIKTAAVATTESISLRANASGGRSSEIAIEGSGSTNRIRMLVYSGSGATSGQLTLAETSFAVALNGTGTNDFSVDGTSAQFNTDVDLNGNDITDVGTMTISSTAQSSLAFGLTNYYIGVLSNVDPLINFDATDYLAYSRSSNALTFTVGGTTRLTVNASGVSSTALSSSPAAGTSALSVTTPTNQTAGGIVLGDGNCGSSFGPFVAIGRNNNGSTPSAGWLRLFRRDGSTGDLWVDASGNLRIGAATAVTNATDTGGTVVGTQTSSLDSKHIIEQFVDYSSALNAIVDAPLYDFTYKSGAFNNQRFTGIVTDYSPMFGMDRDETHPAGKSLNEVTAHGYTFAAIKALHKRIEELEKQVKELQHA